MTSKKQLRQMKEIVDDGKWNFVLVRGIVFWGGGMALFMILFNKFILGEEMNIIDINIFLIIFTIGGLIWGLIVWESMKKKIRENGH